MTDEVVSFARARNPSRTTTELRVEVPKDVVGVIDAHWMARSGDKASRQALVNEILGEWAERKWHEASLVLQLVPGNPDRMETRDEKND